MTMQTIVEALKRDPFRPFRVWTSSGEHYEVRNPELVVPLRHSLFIAMAELERTAMLSHLRTTALETIDSRGKKKTSRRGPRR